MIGITREAAIKSSVYRYLTYRYYFKERKRPMQKLIVSERDFIWLYVCTS